MVMPPEILLELLLEMEKRETKGKRAEPAAPESLTWQDDGRALIPLHCRHSHLLSLGGRLCAQGATAEQLFDAFLETNRRFRPPESTAELWRQACWMAVHWSGRSGLVTSGSTITATTALESVFVCIHRQIERSPRGVAELTQQDIAHRTGWSRRTVGEAVRKLVLDLKLFKRWVARYAHDQCPKRKPTRYYLTSPFHYLTSPLRESRESRSVISSIGKSFRNAATGRKRLYESNAMRQRAWRERQQAHSKAKDLLPRG
jgi:hypothetical protein